MTETAVRAERLDAPGFRAPFYTWEIAGKPVSVAIPLGVIDQLEREVVESFRSLSSRGSEIGGVLFGNVAPGTPSLVTIASYEVVSCDYSRGPLYRLSDADVARMDRAIAQAAPSGLTVVGFFRSHTRKGISLDQDDRELLDLRFADRHCMALLIRPFAAKPSAAGIFIREGSEVHSEASYLEFPFRSSELAFPSRAAATATRAQIVPIAPRREAAPADLPAVLLPPMAVTTPVQGTATEPPLELALEPKPKPAPEPEPAPAAELPEMAPERAPEHVAVETVAPKRDLKRAALYLAGIAALVIGVCTFVYIGGKSKLVTPMTTGSTMSLRVERSAGELLLTWNRDSEAIRGASRAVLEIADGPQRENVEMDLAQLRNGSIVYSPATSDVVFKMDVTGQDSTETISESVRVLSTRPSPMAPAAAQKPAAVTTDPLDPVVAEPEAASAPSTPPRPTKPFNADSLSQRLRAATSQDLPDAPAVSGSTTPAPLMPALGQTTIAPPPPPAAENPTPPVVNRPAVKGGQIEQAQLIRRIDPEYPKIARDSGAKGIVKLSATIGADGRVKSVKALGGHPLLVRAATEAVMLWIYRPTMLNGTPVETQTEIALNFVNER